MTGQDTIANTTAPKPASAKTRKQTQSASSKRLKPRLRVLGLLATATIATAAVAGSIYGLPAALAITGFVTAMGGLVKALIDLHVVLEKREAEGTLNSEPQRYKRGSLMPIVSGAIFIGLLIGYIPVPWLIDLAVQPSATVNIPSSVSAVQTAQVYWRNIPPSDNVHVLVRENKASGYFAQRCQSSGSRRGAMSCDLEIGGNEDGGRLFDIRVVRVPHNKSRQFATGSAEGDFLPMLPEGMQVVASHIVTRQ